LVATDAILCRNTKPLVEAAYALIKRGVACHVEGREIGAGLIKLVSRWKVKTLPALRTKLEDHATKQCAKLIAKGKETQAANLMDRIETVYVIMDSQPPMSTVEELRDRIRRMFKDGEDEDKPTLTLATVHKSKGREWDRVFVLGRNAYMPSPFARQEWQQQQERNLIYVAYTRAKSELVLVSAAAPKVM
jgi:superfamily I DNA/RNA helicase